MKKIWLIILCIILFGGLVFLLREELFVEAGTNILDSYGMGKINDPELKGVPGYTNFGKTFGSGNYRGAMPTAPSIKILKEKYEITTIVTLTPLSQMPEDVQKAIKESKLTRIVIPLGGLPPKEKNWKRILAVLKQGHTFVHCLHGADRTGGVIARARVELGGVTPDQAYKDMLTYNPKVEKSNHYRKDFAKFKNFIYHGYSQ